MEHLKVAVLLFTSVAMKKILQKFLFSKSEVFIQGCTGTRKAKMLETF